MLASVAELIGELGAGLRIGFDDVHLSVRAHAQAVASTSPSAAELDAAGGLVEQLRAVKDDDEIEAIARRRAAGRRDLRWLISEHGLAGHTERAVARAMERHVQDTAPTECRSRRSSPPDRERRAAARRAARRGDSARHAGRGRLRRACSTATARTAPGRSRPATWSRRPRETYELVRAAQAEALDGGRARAPTCARSTRSRAS